MGRKGKWEYFRAIYGRYQKADRIAKQLMLNEFCLTTGYPRKYAIRFEWTATWEATRSAGTAAGAELWARTTVHPDQRMGGSRVSLVGAVESAATGLDAVDPQALQVKPRDGETTALDQSAAEGSSTGCQEESKEAAQRKRKRASCVPTICPTTMMPDWRRFARGIFLL